MSIKSSPIHRGSVILELKAKLLKKQAAALAFKRERRELKTMLMQARNQAGDLKADLKVAHAEVDSEKIKADAFLVAAECANRSLQRHIRVLHRHIHLPLWREIMIGFTTRW